MKQLRLTAGDKKLALEKQGDQWQIVEPAHLKADNSAVSSPPVFAHRPDGGPIPRRPTTTANADFDAPKLTAWMSTAAPTTQPSAAAERATSVPAIGELAPRVITFGQFADMKKQKIYVQTANPAALATASFPQSSLDSLTGASPLTLRDKDVLNVPQGEVSKIALTIETPATQPATTQAATTQPPTTQATVATTQPAVKRVVLIERRSADLPPLPQLKPIGAVLSQKPIPLASAPTTTPAATQAASRPAVSENDIVSQMDNGLQSQLPPKPPRSPWVILSDGGQSGDDKRVDEGRISDLLRSLDPLRAEKFVEKSPATQPSDVKGHYELKITTVGPGGTPVKDWVVRLVDRGADLPAVGEYNPPPLPSLPATLVFETSRAILKNVEGDLTAKKPEATPSANDESQFPPGSGFPGGMPRRLPPGLMPR